MKQIFTLPSHNGEACEAPPHVRGRQGGGKTRFRELPPLVLGNARRLRRNMTDAEKKLWRHLNKRQLHGMKFRRQHPIGNYIVDFACVECRLVIEVDGGQHQLRAEYDRQRDMVIGQQGYRVLRFWNSEVLRNMDGVLWSILQAIDPHLASPCKGEEMEYI